MRTRLFWISSLLLALVLTWPMVLHPWSQALGSADGDGPKHIWNLWWMRQEVLHGPWGLLTTYVNYPTGMWLYPIEPLNGLLSLLLPLPPIPLSNLLALLNLTLLGGFSAMLGERISGDRNGGLIAGALAQSSAFAAFTLHVGVGELREIWWIPLGLYVAERAKAHALDPRVPHRTVAFWFLGLAACLAGAVLSCFYHGFFLATAMSLWALATLQPVGRLLGGYAMAAGLSLALVYPVVHSFSGTYGDGGGKPKESFSQWMGHWQGPVEQYRFAALDPYEALVPRLEARKQTDRQQLAYTGGRYLGISTLILGLLGLAAAPRKALPWLGVALGSFVLAMGTVPWWHGEVITLGGGRILLPLAWINRALAYVAEPLNFPARYLSVTTIALAMLGALASRWRWSWILAPIAVVEVMWGDMVPWPRATFALPEMSGLEAGEGAVFEASMVAKAGQSNGGGEVSVIAGIDPETRLRAMAAQIELGRPIQGMPVERVDHWATDGMAWARALPLSQALIAGHLEQPASAYQADLWLLRDRGFDRVLLTHDSRNGAPPQLKALLDQLLQPGSHAPSGTIWVIPEVSATPEQQAQWRSEQEQRAAKYGGTQLAPQYFPGK